MERHGRVAGASQRQPLRFGAPRQVQRATRRASARCSPAQWMRTPKRVSSASRWSTLSATTHAGCGPPTLKPRLHPCCTAPAAPCDCSAIQAANRLPNGSACEPLAGGLVPAADRGTGAGYPKREGYIWITWRTDDIVKVSADWLSTAGGRVADVNVLEAAVIGGRAHGKGEFRVHHPGMEASRGEH